MSYMSKAGLRETTQTRQGAEEDRRQSKEKPMLSSTGVGTPRKKGGGMQDAKYLFPHFSGGGANYVRAQGGRPLREREEIVRAPRGKLLPEAGDRPAPGREAPAPYPTKSAWMREAASGNDGASPRRWWQQNRIDLWIFKGRLFYLISFYSMVFPRI